MAHVTAMILTIHRALKDRLRAVLTELYGLDPDATPEIAVQYPPNRTLGDLGIPVAFELARTLRKAPKAIATEVVAALGPIDGIARAEAAPNGYVNVFFDRATFLRKACTTPAAGATAPAAQTKTIVEHTAINPNKAAHIGHLRNSALGDTLVRVLRFLGTPVEVQNYIDDTGVQVADVAVGFEQLEHASIDDVTALAAKPRFDFYCWDLYARVTEWYTGDDDRLAHRTRALRDLEAGDTPTAAIGQAVVAHIVRCHLATMDRLNVEYDLLSWEGDILRLEFWARAFAVLQEADAIFLQTVGPQAGCWVMPLAAVPREDKGVGAEAGDATGEGLDAPAKIIVRSNGTVTYVGKDIAYQFWKCGVLDRDFRYRHHSNQRSGRALWSTTAESIARTDGPVPPAFGDAAAVYNVIDTRQSYLQELLKQALRAIDRQPQADRSVHVSYEMVALSHGTARALGHDADPDERRPFVEVSGRKGLGVKADDLLDRVTAAARREVLERHVDLAENETEAERIAAIIAVAAIRYFMIKYSRGKLIVFDIDEALSFEGESGPYVQYAAVRAEKILDKLRQRHGTDDAALVDALATLPDAALDDPNGTDPWALVLEAARLDEVAEQSVRALELSVLAKYAFGLAQAFNTFYHRCPVIAEERRDVRLWRAAAVTYARLQLGRALDLMGCEVPPRM